jgi:hypothetical protein
MSHSVGSSDVGDYEDPNIPTDVGCGGQHQEGSSSEDQDDNLSISSDLSDQSMKQHGLTYDCKPDISEVAGLNECFGDLANMACHEESQSNTILVEMVLGPVYSMEDAENLTWSQLLDNEGRQPRLGIELEQSSKSFIWTQGYDETASLSGVSLVFPEQQPFSIPYKLTRRPSDMSSRSLSGLRLRPLNALKRFLSRRKPNRMFVKDSLFICTADSNRRVEAARAG